MEYHISGSFNYRGAALRFDLTAPDEEAIDEALERWMNRLTEKGATFGAPYKAKTEISTASPPVSDAAASAPPPAPAPAAAAPTSVPDDKTLVMEDFEPVFLYENINGKPSAKVFGTIPGMGQENFTTYGIKTWPEPFESIGINLESPVVSEAHPNGWVPGQKYALPAEVVAVRVLWDYEKGRPIKVVGFRTEDGTEPA